MNSVQVNYSFNVENNNKKQEFWRNKQFNVFYGSGRPIFNIDQETKHLRYHHNPEFVKDYNKIVIGSGGKNFVPIKQWQKYVK